MVQKFKSKFAKRAQDNEKRKETLQRKYREKLSHKEVIKNALSASSAGKSKKIIFDGDDMVEENENNDGQKLNSSYNSCTLNKSGEKINLFDESDNDGMNYEIKIKNEFEGKKGHKLLKLQSNYNNDERFKLDERFYDDEENDGDYEPVEENDQNVEQSAESNEIKEEKARQLKILEDVLGHSIQSKEKKPKKSFIEMVRFDASNEDHRRQETMVQEDISEKSVKKKRKLDKEERKKRKKELTENEPKVDLTSEEKFYKVSDDLKQALMNRKNENAGQFSLLGAFSKNDIDEESSKSGAESENENVYDTNKEDVQMEEHQEEMEKVEVTKAQGIKKEKFFFSKDDPRIDEGLKFINMKNSEEAKRARDSYDSTRKDIREVLRLRWQKHRQRNNPFKKKIGGSLKSNPTYHKRGKFLGKNSRNRRK